MTRVGFTGTQHGMSAEQVVELRRELLRLHATELHHGDCIGADAQADAIARQLGLRVVIHPPIDPTKRAFCAVPGDEVLPELPYLDRNHELVVATESLIAAPRTIVEEQRSGTWATIRYARNIRRPVVILERGRT